MQIVSSPIVMIVTSFVRADDPQAITWTTFLLSILLQLTYFALIPVIWDGQTVGKRMMSIRIVRLNGEPITFWSMFLRNFLGYTISGAVFSLGYIWILFDDRKQGWHDKIANTVVVRA